jgi:hypothetical protein
MKDERIKTNRPGQPPTIYGGRTFKGWASYYEVFGNRKPCARTISSHYARAKASGLTDHEIIKQQRALWRDEALADRMMRPFSQERSAEGGPDNE